MSLLLSLIFIWINLAIWYCLRGGGHGFIFFVVVFCFFSSWESSFILAHWVSTLGRACSARENCVDPCPARQSSRHRWALAQLVHMVLHHLVKKSVWTFFFFFWLSFTAPLLLTLWKEISYRIKPCEFNSDLALSIFQTNSFHHAAALLAKFSVNTRSFGRSEGHFLCI